MFTPLISTASGTNGMMMLNMRTPFFHASPGSGIINKRIIKSRSIQKKTGVFSSEPELDLNDGKSSHVCPSNDWL